MGTAGLDGLIGKAELTADDTLAARRAVYVDDMVSRPEADAVLSITSSAKSVSAPWREFYIEAVSLAALSGGGAPGYVDEDAAGWLTGRLGSGRTLRDEEVDLLIHILETADACPAALESFTLDALKRRIVAGSAGVSAEDVERLRRTVFASGGGSNIGVTRPEAQALFEIDRAVQGRMNASGWPDFFARAVANAVLYEATWRAPDADEALSRERWLEDTGFHPFAFLRSAFGGGGSVAQILATPDVEHAWRDGVAADEAIEAEAASVTSDEAAWLVAQIGDGGSLSPAETALLAFLDANAASVDPALRALIASRGAAARAA